MVHEDTHQRSAAPRKPFLRDADVLGLGGLLLGLFIAAGAVAFYLAFPGRPDVQEMRDLGVLVGFEVAALSIAFSSLVKITARRPKDDSPYAL
jgi:hypothetical protein